MLDHILQPLMRLILRTPPLILAIVLTVGFATYIAAQTVPAIWIDRDSPNLSNRIDELKVDMFQRLERLDQLPMYRPSTTTGVFDLPVSELVDARVTLVVHLQPDAPFTIDSLGIEKTAFQLRWDRLIPILGVWAITVIMTLSRTIYEYIAPEQIDRRTGRAGRRSRNRLAEDSKASSRFGKSQNKTDLAFLDVLEDAYKRSNDIYARSSLLLGGGGGIIMAFIGVATFYFTLPDVQQQPQILAAEPSRGPDQDWHVAQMIRATGMLFFIEAIAWFLLRQYRALVDDFKIFHRIYLRRANYYIAFKLLEKETESPQRLLLATSLVSEDLSGRLQATETTEALEAVKAIEPNPVFGLVERALERMQLKMES